MRVVREQPEKYFCAHLFNVVGQSWVGYLRRISPVRMDGEVENSRKYVEEAITKEDLHREIEFDRCGAMVPVITVHDIAPCHCF